MTAERVGVVLAAGFGSRLGDEAVKPLTLVGGRPLIAHALGTLAAAGCRRVVVVLGHAADRVREGAVANCPDEMELAFVFNDRFDLSNGVSLLCARPLVPGTFVLTMVDHVVDRAVARLAATTQPVERGAVLLIDRRVDAVFDLDDATKVRIDDNAIVAIGKELTDFDAIDIGVFVGTVGWFDTLSAELAERGDASLSDGVRRLAEAGRMHVADIGDAFWQDVDTPEMLAHAEANLAANPSDPDPT